MTEKILVPNIGDFKNVEIIEVLVKEGDKINKGDPIITLESDKSSVEVPSTINGSIEKVKIKIGDKVSEGDLILTINPENKQVEKKKEKTIKEVKTSKAVKKTAATPIITQVALSGIVGASPNVMRFARELGVDLSQVHGTGRDGRVLEIDIKEHVKNIGSASSSKKNIIEDMPYPHSEFGDIKVKKLPPIPPKDEIVIDPPKNSFLSIFNSLHALLIFLNSLLIVDRSLLFTSLIFGTINP